MTDPEVSWLKEFIGWIAGGVFGVAMGIMALISRYSRVALGRARDSDEVKTMAEKNARIAKLESEIDVLAKERNEAVSKAGGLESAVKYLGEQVEAMRDEQRARSVRVLEELNKQTERSDHKIDENTKISREARDRADAAYKAANNVNEKIENISRISAAKRDEARE